MIAYQRALSRVTVSLLLEKLEYQEKTHLPNLMNSNYLICCYWELNPHHIGERPVSTTEPAGQLYEWNTSNKKVYLQKM